MFGGHAFGQAPFGEEPDTASVPLSIVSAPFLLGIDAVIAEGAFSDLTFLSGVQPSTLVDSLYQAPDISGQRSPVLLGGLSSPPAKSGLGRSASTLSAISDAPSIESVSSGAILSGATEAALPIDASENGVSLSGIVE